MVRELGRKEGRSRRNRVMERVTEHERVRQKEKKNERKNKKQTTDDDDDDDDDDDGRTP